MKQPSYEPILIAEDVSRMLDGEDSVRERLDRAVSRLKAAMGVDVCTLYRVSQRRGDLYLESTDGLAAARVGKLALRRGEGLTGLVVDSRRPLAVRDGPSHPRFRYLPGSDEESFHSFLGAPILMGRRVIGALIVQTIQPRDFGREDIALLNTISRTISNVANQIFRQLERQSEAGEAGEKDGPARFRGRSLADGCYMGPPLAVDTGMDLETAITPVSRGAKHELAALRAASRSVIGDLEREARAISATDGHAVLMAHRVILEDPELVAEATRRIEQGASAAEAVRATGLRWVQVLEKKSERAFAARAADFRDIANRLLRALGVGQASVAPAEGRHVAIARAMLPGDLLALGPERIGAMVITDAGIYSHTAILARAFGIPAVQIDAERLEEMLRARRLLVDGGQGLVVCDPTDADARAFIARAQKNIELPEKSREHLADPVRTPDGLGVRIGLNAGMAEEFGSIEELNPDDIGLYRTEIAFMSRDALPGFRAQLAHYKRVVELAGGRRVVFRTFDFGGDKLAKAVRFEPEANPLMGYRSTRFMLSHVDLFHTQLRALFTASQSGPISILLPMIATPEEMNLVLDEINVVRNQLEHEGEEFDRAVPVGVMLEVPSVLFSLPELSKLSDFFCVGANDLVQYLMAADRANPRVAGLYQWHHPSVLNALEHLLRHCRGGPPVTMCGEMANHPWAAMLLIGMGYEHLSVDASSIPLLKWTLRNVPSPKMRSLATAAMRCASSTGVLELFYKTLADFRREGSVLTPMLAASLDRLRAHATW